MASSSGLSALQYVLNQKRVPSMPGTPERWFYSLEELAKTPSQRSGKLSYVKELEMRQDAAGFIIQLCTNLKLPQYCSSASIVYMHRFYTHHSFTRFPGKEVAPACVFLAAKVEENPRKLEYVIKVAHTLLNKGRDIQTTDEAYLDMAQKIVMHENILLQTLGFDLQVEHPHASIVKCCTLVKAPKELAQASYFVASDSLQLTDYCLRYRPTVVACVCIHLACKWANFEIPDSSEGRPWYFYVDNQMKKEILDQITDEFLKILEASSHKLRTKKIGHNTHHQRPHQQVAAPVQQHTPPQVVPDGPKLEPIDEESACVAPAAKLDPTSPSVVAAAWQQSGSLGGSLASATVNVKTEIKTPPKQWSAPGGSTSAPSKVVDIAQYKERRKATADSDCEASGSQGQTKQGFMPDPKVVHQIAKLVAQQQQEKEKEKDKQKETGEKKHHHHQHHHHRDRHHERSQHHKRSHDHSDHSTGDDSPRRKKRREKEHRHDRDRHGHGHDRGKKDRSEISAAERDAMFREISGYSSGDGKSKQQRPQTSNAGRTGDHSSNSSQAVSVADSVLRPPPPPPPQQKGQPSARTDKSSKPNVPRLGFSTKTKLHPMQDVSRKAVEQRLAQKKASTSNGAAGRSGGDVKVEEEVKTQQAKIQKLERRFDSSPGADDNNFGFAKAAAQQQQSLANM